MKIIKSECKCKCQCRQTMTLELTPEEVHDLKVIATAVDIHPVVLNHAEGITPKTRGGCRTHNVYPLLKALRGL